MISLNLSLGFFFKILKIMNRDTKPITTSNLELYTDSNKIIK